MLYFVSFHCQQRPDSLRIVVGRAVVMIRHQCRYFLRAVVVLDHFKFLNTSLMYGELDLPCRCCVRHIFTFQVLDFVLEASDWFPKLLLLLLSVETSCQLRLLYGLAGRLSGRRERRLVCLLYLHLILVVFILLLRWGEERLECCRSTSGQVLT